MAEYGKNQLTNELAAQYLAELNDSYLGDGTPANATTTCWWPCVADELPHPKAGEEYRGISIDPDATIPDPVYNINATFDVVLSRFILTKIEDKYS